MVYQPPVLEMVGSVSELTLALNQKGPSDHVLMGKMDHKLPGGGGGLS